MKWLAHSVKNAYINKILCRICNQRLGGHRHLSIDTETEMSFNWRYLDQLMHRKFSFGQIPVVSMTFPLQRKCLWWCDDFPHGPFARYVNCGLSMRREIFPRHRGLAIPTCITARAWRTCRDACRDRQLVVGGGENVPGIPGACTTRNFTYLIRGPLLS